MDELAQTLSDVNAMNPHLRDLPQPLLAQLGTQSRLQCLQQLSQLQGVDAQRLFQCEHGRAYTVHVSEHGLSLTLQCLNPTAAQEQQLWGLHSFTLHALAWRGPWFEGLQPEHTTAQALIERLGNPPDERTEEASAEPSVEPSMQATAQAGEVDGFLHQPPVLCMALRGPHGQAWSAVAMFDMHSHRLDTFCLAHTGAWCQADPLPKQPAQEQTETPSTAKWTCRSGERAPVHGVWEATLPTQHPHASLYAQAPHRFMYRRAGDPMGVLGLAAADEALVTWRWVGA